MDKNKNNCDNINYKLGKFKESFFRKFVIFKTAITNNELNNMNLKKTITNTILQIC